MASGVEGLKYKKGLHLIGSRRSYARDFLGKDQGFEDTFQGLPRCRSRDLRTSHWFRALVKALKESKDKRRKGALDWYGNVQEYRGDLAQGNMQQVKGLYIRESEKSGMKTKQMEVKGMQQSHEELHMSKQE